MTFGINGGGAVNTIIVTSKSSIATVLKAYLFNANPNSSTWTDKVTPAINTADIASLIGVISLPTPDHSLGTMTMWASNNNNLQFVSTTGSIWVVLVAMTAGTLTSTSTSDITVALGVQQ
jgi:hypothetical protein